MPKPFAITADLHLDEHQAFATSVDGFNSRLLDIERVWKKIIDACVKRGIKTLVVAGDWINHRRRVTVHTLYVSARMLAYAAAKGVSVTLLLGNHDMSLDGTANSVAGLGFARVITKPGVEVVNGHVVLFIPWTDDAAEVKKSLKLPSAAYPASIVIGHLGVKGGTFGPSDTEVPGGVPSETLSRAKVPVVLGHYHKPQSLGNVHYVGSPLQLSWGETGEDKRFFIWDGKELESVPLPDSPRFVRVKNDNLSRVRSQDFVSIEASPGAVDRCRAAVDRAGLVNAIVTSRAPVPEARVRADMDGKGPLGQFREYVKIVSPEGVSVKRLTRMAAAYLGEGS